MCVVVFRMNFKNRLLAKHRLGGIAHRRLRTVAFCGREEKSRNMLVA